MSTESETVKVRHASPREVRRRARDWSLRTLYQIDVGGVTVDDALSGTMEQLRHEFVQNVRTGSPDPVTERAALECITAALAAEVAAGATLRVRDLPAWVQALFIDLPRRQEQLCRAGLARVAPVALFGDERAADWNTAISEPGDVLQLLHTPLADVREQVSLAAHAELAASARRFVAQSRACLKAPQTAAGAIRSLREEARTTSVERWRHAGRAAARQVVDWFETSDYARRLVTGTQTHLSEIDSAMRVACKGWAMDRLAAPDRNIIRQAYCELRWFPDLPARVVINEAVELAKRYGSADSGSFVNGVLGALLRAQTGACEASAERQAAEELECLR
ncbi:MAG: transcription antitermination factor NusB [Armatimonadetes bacterium]|nr:transcription antitermination factor NusB [Armatimonadota bacterium]MDE2206700.1 transcription antitermination factor NusB [Armatimonadota bacterium]